MDPTRLVPLHNHAATRSRIAEENMVDVSMFAGSEGRINRGKWWRGLNQQGPDPLAA